MYRKSPSHPLLGDRFRIPVEQVVSEHYGRKWRAEGLDDLKEFASHPAAILSDGERSVFAKLSEAAHALDQFEAELAGLRLLSERSGVLVPTPIGVVRVVGGAVLVLDAVQAIERSSLEWQEIGRTLARIHQVKGERCGSERGGYFGPFYQDNRPMHDWLSFFTERRLWPRFIGAIDSGNLTTEMIRLVERLIGLLPDLCIPETEPSLLHGDAQQNNFISTGKGAMVIDPAVHYGSPEIDLALVDYFQDVPDDVFLGYQEIMPIDPGFQERRDLWRVPAYLAAVTVEGPDHLDKLIGAVQKYV